MKIMVFDVPAERGGALSILNEFYNKLRSDENNEYIFVLSKPKLEETKNIKVLRFPWIKKSWLHRLYFDNFVAPKLIIDYEVDEVLSLQNVIIPRSKVHQTVYVHNCLPFVDYKFSLKENKLLWIYQNILSKNIYKSIKIANKVIVQTKWMKILCVKRLNIDEAKVEIMLPKVNIEVKKRFDATQESLSTFFYPASGVIFKNHEVIVKACLELKKKELNKYKVIFTLKGDENKNISTLYKIIEEHKLPISFVGCLSREKVFDYYSRSVLLFPSYIETVGLPLIEARMHEAPIIVSDCIFSHEILDGYDKKNYFNFVDYHELGVLMKKYLDESEQQLNGN